MLTRFEVRDYKCIEHIDIPLTPIHVIVGQNDSGKTSLLEAIFALHRSVSRSLADSLVGAWDGEELVRAGANSHSVELGGTFVNSANAEALAYAYRLGIGFPRSGRNCVRRYESYRRSDDWDLEIQVPVVSPEMVSALSAVANTPIDLGELEWLRSIADLIGSAHLYRLDPKAMATPTSVDTGRVFRLDEDGFGLPTLLDDILGSDPLLFIKLSEHFCTYFPQFTRVKVQTEKAVERNYQSTGFFTANHVNGRAIYLDMPEGPIRAQQASDGAVLFLGLLALMYSPRAPKVLLIEEPEKGVYPKRLGEIIDLLRRLSSESSRGPVPQIIMTTHSPYLLSAFSPDEVTLLRRKDGTGPVEAFPLRDAPHIHERLGDNEFYLGELWYNLSEEELLGRA